MIYSKGATTVAAQIIQLKNRGMIIEDDAYAQHHLSNISYYRLAGYWWTMQSNSVAHQFRVGSKFEDVIALYNFDRELRVLIFDVIERLEIGIRTKLVTHMSHEVSPWWFEDRSIFQNSRQFSDTLFEIRTGLSRSKEVFILEHVSKYVTDTRFPPCWKTLEIVSFGTLSKLYGNLIPSIKSKDEIGRLTGGFNQMVTTLASTQQQLKEYNQKLEGQVAQRTQELQTKIGE